MSFAILRASGPFLAASASKLSYIWPTIACRFPLNKPFPNAIRKSAKQVRVSNQVVLAAVARIGMERIMYPVAITTRPVLIVPL